MLTPYIGSGPYCYANCLAMMLPDASLGADVIEVLTGSPFGFQLLAGRRPLFDPLGWDPDLGIDQAIELLGLTCERAAAPDEASAAEWLTQAAKTGPWLAGPVEMGLLRHQPGMTGPLGADHFVIVLDATDDMVTFHDPQGHPFATIPTKAFVAAWRTDTLGYGASFTARWGFRRLREVTPESALADGLGRATAWLDGTDAPTVPNGTVGGAAGLRATARWFANGIDDDARGELAHFAIRVGARRLHDAAAALQRLGLDEAAADARRQSRLVGALQYPVATGDDALAARLLDAAADNYELWARSMHRAGDSGRFTAASPDPG